MSPPSQTKALPDHNKISPTAKLVAYWRQHSDIPFAKDVAELAHAEETVAHILSGTGIRADDLKWAAPYAELRYKSMVEAIKAAKNDQVIEFASGLSLRGLALTSEPHAQIRRYVETDLPEMSAEKIMIVDAISKSRRLQKSSNLHFFSTNILNKSEIEAATASFDRKKPVTIVHEGLFQYLSMEERVTAANNLRWVLQTFGGAWITPDFESLASQTNDDQLSQSKTNEAQKSAQKLIAGITRITQRDLAVTAFEDDEEIYTFFTKLGFRISAQPAWDGKIPLKSPSALQIPMAAIEPMISKMRLWTVTL